jgi:hypothetical protein
MNFFQRTFDTARDFASNLYTGVDRLAGGILPGGQDFNQGYIANIGTNLGLIDRNQGVPGGVASTIDTQSIQPNLDLNYEQPSQESALQDFFSPVDQGTMGLSEAFGSGGGFIPPGYNSEAEMVAAGIGDGWTPTTYYEFTTQNGSPIGVTDLENGRFKIDTVDANTGLMETFIQTGYDGKSGITDYENNATAAGEMAVNTGATRINGIDLSSLFATAAIDPNSKLEMGTKMGSNAVDMQRIDNLDSATFISLTPSSPIGGGGGVTAESEKFSNDVLNYMNQLDQAGLGTVIESNPLIQEVKNGKSVEEVFGTTFTNTDPIVNDIGSDLNTTLPALDNNSSLADAFSSGGLADGNQTATNNINPDGSLTEEGLNEISNQNSQISLDQNATNEASTGGNADISKNVATGIGTSIVDGNEFEFVYDPSKVDPTVTESQLDSGFKLFSEEAFREFDDSLRVSTGKNPIPDSAGSNDQGFDLDLFSKARADFIDVYQKSGATIDQVNDLKQQVNKIDLIGKAKNILPTLNANNFIGTIQSIIKTPTRFKLFQNSTDAHNIRQSQIKELNPIKEDLAEEAGRKYEDVKDILNMELTLPQLIEEVENIIEQVETSGIDADLTPTKELLTELQTAELYGKDVAILKDSDYDRIYSNEYLDSTIDGLEDVDLSKDDYVKVYNHKGEEVSNTNIYSENTKREPESWGVINEDGGAVAKWNPFEPESRQERDMRNTINPNRGFGDGTGLDPIKYPDQASMGYSSPTMATIDRNIRPTLDRVGDFIEYPFEVAGMGMYNTIGQLPLVGGAGKSIGNALARTGQGIDRAIDTKLPDSLFGLKTGDDGTGGDGEGNEISPEMFEVMKSGIYEPGNSPLVEILRDKHYGTGYYANNGTGGQGTPGYYMNSVSDPSMTIYGGSGGVASSGGVPGGVGGMDGGSGSARSGMSSMADGFDLSTPDGQAKYADLYGEDRLADELSRRGLFDRRAAEVEQGNPEQGDAYAGIANENYRLKEHFEQPQQNLGEEIAKGINKVQGKEGVFA